MKIMNWLQKILSQSQSNAPQPETDIQRPLKQSYQVTEHLWAGEYPGDKNGEYAKAEMFIAALKLISNKQ
jgi:hypothetical protein